jgi:N-acetylneuraminate epimerase
MFAGPCDGALVVAGGAPFPGARPWQGGVKHWSDKVWALDDRRGPWREVGRLRRPVAYGVSAATPDGLICAGGGDAAGHFEEVSRLSIRRGHLEIEAMLPLPRPCSFAFGAMVGDTLYLAGGIDRPDATTCLRTFWSLDVRRPGSS